MSLKLDDVTEQLRKVRWDVMVGKEMVTAQVQHEERRRNLYTFNSQIEAERSYHRIEAGYLARGKELTRLQHRIGRQRQHLREIHRAAEQFANGEITAGKLAEVLGVRDKHAFKLSAGSFDTKSLVTVQLKDGWMER